MDCRTKGHRADSESVKVIWKMDCGECSCCFIIILAAVKPTTPVPQPSSRMRRRTLCLSVPSKVLDALFLVDKLYVRYLAKAIPLGHKTLPHVSPNCWPVPSGLDSKMVNPSSVVKGGRVVGVVFSPRTKSPCGLDIHCNA